MKEYGYIVAPAIGWVVAQGLKFLISLKKDGLQWVDFYQSGGFPSSHTAITSALTALIALRHGFTSEYFAIAATLTGIVIYDALGVRRSSGEQAMAIQELAKKTDQHISTVMHKARGHTPVEVLGGLVVGCAVGTLIYLFVK